MKKCYLLAFDEAFKRDEVKQIIEEIPEITFWRYDMSNAFYVISTCSADELMKKFRAFSKERGRFIFTELAGNENGLLTTESWYLITNKVPKPKTASPT